MTDTGIPRATQIVRLKTAKLHLAQSAATGLSADIDWVKSLSLQRQRCVRLGKTRKNIKAVLKADADKKAVFSSPLSASILHAESPADLRSVTLQRLTSDKRDSSCSGRLCN